MTVTAGVVGAALAIGFTWSNTAPPENTKPTGGPVKIAAPPKPIPLRLRDRAAALVVASRFIDNAVARKNVDRAWGLVTPTLRAGYTRRQWDALVPDIPPFPVASARWQLQFSDVKGIGFTMALFPPKRSHQSATVFMIGLHKVGSGKHRHWLVDNWQPAPITASQVASGGGGGSAGGVLDQITPRVTATSAKAKESPIWLLIPVGLLSLILIIPAGIAGTSWYRNRRARTLFGE